MRWSIVNTMAAKNQQGGRINQKRRTEEALVAAARELVAEGRMPSVAEVADAALVSRATAYRYFPSQAELLSRVLFVDQGIAELKKMVEEGMKDPDASHRLDTLVRAYLQFVDRYEDRWRTMMSYIVAQGCSPLPNGDPGINAGRGAQRLVEIRRALEPVRDRLADAEAARLESALAMCAGSEAFFALRDVMGLGETEAEEVASWASQALLEKAVRDSASAGAAARKPRKPAAAQTGSAGGAAARSRRQPR